MEQSVRIERMAYGPEAVGRLANGKTVFVGGAAPGELVRVQLVEDKPQYALARLISVEETSPCRVAAPCSASGSCSACSWQHLSYEAQISAKRNNVVAVLKHNAGFDEEEAQNLVEPCIPSKKQMGYRNKLELALQRTADGKLDVGLTRQSSHELVSLDECPLAHPAIQKAPKALRGALRFLEAGRDLGIFRLGVRVSARTGSLEVALWTRPGPFPRTPCAKTIESSLKATSVVRVLADPGHARRVKKLEVLAGKGYWEEELCGLRFRTQAPSFFQVNTAQAEVLLRRVLAGLGADKGLAGKKLADLYAGGGTFSLPLAKAGAQLIAVEAAASSVRDLRGNAKRNRVEVEVRGGDAARELAQLGRLDALVVDPPRAGLAKEILQGILKAQPDKVAYISCNPATWARDVARFAHQGYKLVSAQPVDMFPNTHHVEIVSFFEPI